MNCSSYASILGKEDGTKIAIAEAIDDELTLIDG